MKYTIKAKEGSGIHINPANKGKFTVTKKKTGKSTEELTHSKNLVTKKRAIFAQNAKKWKHENGGEIEKKKPMTGLIDTVNIVAKKVPSKEQMVKVRSLKELQAADGDYPSTSEGRIERKARDRGENFMPAKWVVKSKPKLKKGGTISNTFDISKILDIWKK